MDDFREMFYETNTGGKIPSGLPGGFFIYEVTDNGRYDQMS